VAGCTLGVFLLAVAINIPKVISSLAVQGFHQRCRASKERKNQWNAQNSRRPSYDSTAS